MEYGPAIPTLRWMAYLGAEICHEVLPLDPVSRDTVGRVQVDKVLSRARKSGLTQFAALIALIHEDTSGTWIEGLRECKRVGLIDTKFRPHFMDLVGCGLLRRSTAERVRFLSGYFEVKKGIDLARAIFNGRRLSKICPTPPNVNLPSHRQFVRQVLDGKCLIAQLDFRHWFHQIRVSENLRQWFGLRIGKEIFEWTCLPMGWSWSPCVAQAISWMMLLAVPPGAKDDLFDVDALLAEGAGLPTWVRTRDRKVVAMVYYDNLIIFASSRPTLDRVLKRLDGNITEFKAEVKFREGEEREKDRQHIPKVQDARQHDVEVLGCVVRAEEGRVTVRPRGLAEWMEDPIEPVMSCRRISKFIGRLIFTASLRKDSVFASTMGRTAFSPFSTSK